MGCFLLWNEVNIVWTLLPLTLPPAPVCCRVQVLSFDEMFETRHGLPKGKKKYKKNSFSLQNTRILQYKRVTANRWLFLPSWDFYAAISELQPVNIPAPAPVRDTHTQNISETSHPTDISVLKWPGLRRSCTCPQKAELSLKDLFQPVSVSNLRRLDRNWDAVTELFQIPHTSNDQRKPAWEEWIHRILQSKFQFHVPL